MTPNSTIRLKARSALGGSIFGSIWLMAILAFLIYSFLTSVSAGVLVVGSLIVIGPLSVGYKSIFMGLSRGEGRVDLSFLFSGFMNDFTNNVVMGIVYSVKVFLWSLLLVVPGIIKAYSYSMCYFIKNDHPELGWRECLAESERIMLGRKWKMFCLELSFIGWIILGSLALGVGTLWVAVYMEQARAQFYEEIK